jgi:hypothetical protein
MYLSEVAPIYKTDGTFSVLTPKYSANLSKSPSPSFLSDKVRITPSGLVSSRAVNACLADSDA